MFHKMKCFILMFVILTCGSAVLFAELTKAEEQEINSYRLTEAKTSQFWNATKNLLAAYQKDPKMFDGIGQQEGQEGSMAEVIERTNKIPAAKKAIEDAGMTAKEYWTFQMAMIYAASGHMAIKAGGTLPPGFSKENMEFYRAHEAEFMKMGEDLKALQELGKNNSDEAEEEQSEEQEERL